jgi:hypothetical protein
MNNLTGDKLHGADGHDNRQGLYGEGDPDMTDARGKPSTQGDILPAGEAQEA